MKAREWFLGMDDATLLGWWNQYGCGKQAAFYNQVARRACRAELTKRGLKFSEKGIEVDPATGKRQSRPDGYAAYGPEFAHPNGWMKFWGLGGKPADLRKKLP